MLIYSACSSNPVFKKFMLIDIGSFNIEIEGETGDKYIDFWFGSIVEVHERLVGNKILLHQNVLNYELWELRGKKNKVRRKKKENKKKKELIQIKNKNDATKFKKNKIK